MDRNKAIATKIFDNFSKPTEGPIVNQPRSPQYQDMLYGFSLREIKAARGWTLPLVLLSLAALATAVYGPIF